MSYGNDASEAPRTVQDSLQAGHRFASVLGTILDGIFSDLTGYGNDTASGAMPSSGIVGDAQSLTNRINAMISTAEQIKEKLATATPADFSAAMKAQADKPYMEKQLEALARGQLHGGINLERGDNHRGY